MATLELTEEEQEAHLFKDFSDKDLGVLTRSFLQDFENESEEQMMRMQAAAFLLIRYAIEMKSDTSSYSAKNFHIANKIFGDWKVTVERIYDYEDEDEGIESGL